MTVVTLADPRITEASGLAASVAHRNLAYICNDENGPLFVVDTTTGKTVGDFRINHTLKDPESLSLHTDGALWVGDTGDNNAARPYVCLYSLKEPGPGKHGTLTARKYKVAYPDGPRNAEALFIHPVTGDRYLISKQSTGHLYRAKAGTLSPTKVNRLEHISTSMPSYVADATFSVDARWVFARQKGQPSTVTVLSATTWRVVGPPIKVPKMTKPETIDVTADGRHLLVGSEGTHSPLATIPLPSQYTPKESR